MLCIYVVVVTLFVLLIVVLLMKGCGNLKEGMLYNLDLDDNTNRYFDAYYGKNLFDRDLYFPGYYTNGLYWSIEPIDQKSPYNYWLQDNNRYYYNTNRTVHRR